MHWASILPLSYTPLDYRLLHLLKKISTLSSSDTNGFRWILTFNTTPIEITVSFWHKLIWKFKCKCNRHALSKIALNKIKVEGFTLPINK